MATSTDSVYVNIIAKTQDAMKGMNDFMKTITLAGAGMYAFRVAVRAVGDAVKLLRENDLELDKSLTNAQTVLRSFASQALQPLAEGIKAVANAIASLDKTAVTLKQLDDIAKKFAGGKTWADIAKEPFMLKQAQLQAAMYQGRESGLSLAPFDIETPKTASGMPGTRFKRGDPIATRLLQEQLNIINEQVSAIDAQRQIELDAADALKAKTKAQAEYNALVKEMIVQLEREILWEETFNPKVLGNAGTAELTAFNNADEWAKPMVEGEAIFSDYDGKILEEIKALREEDEPWLKLFRDDDTETLAEIQRLMTEDSEKFASDMRDVANQIVQVSEALGRAFASGDFSGFIEQLNSMLTTLAIEAAAASAIAMKWDMVAFWLGVAGVSAFAGGLMSGGGGQQAMTGGGAQYPVYSGGGRSITVVNNIGGSVVTERQIAAVTAKHMSEW